MSSPTFTGWRAWVWPIHRAELSKFLALALIFFLISLNYNFLRAYKDTFVITAKNSGAEAIPFIKTWIVLPAALLATVIYTRLANRFHRETVFYIVLCTFLVFFFCFTFVLYPSQDFFHPHQTADWLQTQLPPGLSGLVAAFRHWTFTLFYVFSELWSTMIFTVLFWGFVNEVTSVSDAKRYYPLIMTAGNIAGIFAGQFTVLFSQQKFLPWIPYGTTAWDQSIFLLTCVLLTSGLLMIILFRWLNCRIIHHENSFESKEDTPKTRLSMRESFGYLLRSRYLLYLSIIVLGYNIAINLVEVVWKAQIKLLYANSGEYNVFMGKVTTYMAISATLAGFFAASNIMRKYPWVLSALIPPLLIGGSGFLFFLFVFMKDLSFLAPLAASSTFLSFSVLFGAMQNCLTRACKYTLFDATKEVAFIPLDQEAKRKGKAAIDGIGSRVGKSGGSIIHQMALFIFGSLQACSHYIGIAFCIVVVLWAFAVLALGKRFEALTGQRQQIFSAQ